TRMARIKSDLVTEHPEPTCRDGARARRVRSEPHVQNVFVIRGIREIRGFSFGFPLIRLLLMPALIAVLNLIPAGRVTAQTVTTLHSFTTAVSGTNNDGAYPGAGLF